jgi:23S rRNA (guanosine2251-2'-O)-methyltransferase
MIIFGRNPTLEALRSGRAKRILVCSGQKDILELAAEKNVPVSFIARERLSGLVKTEKHQGAAAEVAEESASLKDILALAERQGEQPFVLMLDSIQDPHNVGAIARSAEVFGVHGLVLPERRSARLTSTVWKTSAGAIGHLPVCLTNVAGAIESLKRKDVYVIGAESEGVPISTQKLSGAIALVIGSEDRGLKPLTRKRCDLIVSVPMRGRVTSLNASVAAGILLYEISRQRKEG